MLVNIDELTFFDPFSLLVAATSPEFGGGREGVVLKTTSEDECANSPT